MISEYTTVVNVLWFWICQGYTRFWIIYFMIDVWQYYEYDSDSEYGRVLNMLGLRMVLNKILHNTYLTRFSICLEFWIYQSYIGFCRKRCIIYAWLSFEYSWGSHYARLKYTRVVSMPRLHRVLCKLYFKDSRYLKWIEFWIC